MWFIGVEVEQGTSAAPPKKNPGSAPALNGVSTIICLFLRVLRIHRSFSSTTKE